MGRRRLLVVFIAGMAFAGPSGAFASTTTANAGHWNDIRREGLTKILYGAALTESSGPSLDRIAAELDRLGGPDPAVTTGLIATLVARSSF